VDPHPFDAHPESTYHPDADPDSDFPDFYLMRMRIQSRLFTLMPIRIRIIAVKQETRIKPLKKGAKS
jgi:hypothetical protein